MTQPEPGTMGHRPYDIQAEQVVLGAMMLSATHRDVIAEIIKDPDDDYYRAGHRAIHRAILRLRDRGEPTDAVAVRIELERRGELVGELNAGYLHTLIERVPVAANGVWHAREIRKYGRTGNMQEGFSRAWQMTTAPGFDPDTDMDKVRAILDRATADQVTGTAAWLSESVFPVMESFDGPLPADQVTTPYADLRAYVPALRRGQLVTVAARPGIGKTVVLGDFARHTALRLGLPVAWFTLEMQRDEIITRCISAEGRVDQAHLQEHALDEREWGRVHVATTTLAEAQVLIDERGASTAAHIRSQIRAMARTAPPALVVVDYLQLMRDPEARTRQEEVSELARGLKNIAKEFNVPVLAAAQLNRGPEGRHDKRPLQSDLRESGEIENSSDVVILLHREDAYEPECQRAGQMDLIVSKNRNGRQGQCTVTFQGKFCRCVDLSRDEEPRDWRDVAYGAAA